MLALFVLGVATGRDIRYMGVGRENPAEQQTDKTSDDTDTILNPSESNDAALSVQPQAAGMTVLAARVSLDAAGWAVVHEVDGGHILNALGAARLDQGAHEKIVVELLRNTEPGREYAVVLYADNGNKEFELRGDLPMIDIDGNPIMQTFKTYGGASAQ